MIFHVVRSFVATNCVWYKKVSYRCLKINLYCFVLVARHNFLFIDQIVVLKEFWRFFDAVRGFYINSAHESNPLFVFILLTESIAKLMYDVQHGISPKSIQALFE